MIFVFLFLLFQAGTVFSYGDVMFDSSLLSRFSDAVLSGDGLSLFTLGYSGFIVSSAGVDVRTRASVTDPFLNQSQRIFSLPEISGEDGGFETDLGRIDANEDGTQVIVAFRGGDVCPGTLDRPGGGVVAVTKQRGYWISIPLHLCDAGGLPNNPVTQSASEFGTSVALVPSPEDGVNRVVAIARCKEGWPIPSQCWPRLYSFEQPGPELFRSSRDVPMITVEQQMPGDLMSPIIRGGPQITLTTDGKYGALGYAMSGTETLMFVVVRFQLPLSPSSTFQTVGNSFFATVGSTSKLRRDSHLLTPSFSFVNDDPDVIVVAIPALGKITQMTYSEPYSEDHFNVPVGFGLGMVMVPDAGETVVITGGSGGLISFCDRPPLPFAVAVHSLTPASFVAQSPAFGEATPEMLQLRVKLAKHSVLVYSESPNGKQNPTQKLQVFHVDDLLAVVPCADSSTSTDRPPAHSSTRSSSLDDPAPMDTHISSAATTSGALTQDDPISSSFPIFIVAGVAGALVFCALVAGFVVRSQVARRRRPTALGPMQGRQGRQAHTPTPSIRRRRTSTYTGGNGPRPSTRRSAYEGGGGPTSLSRHQSISKNLVYGKVVLPAVRPATSNSNYDSPFTALSGRTQQQYDEPASFFHH